MGLGVRSLNEYLLSTCYFPGDDLPGSGAETVNPTVRLQCGWGERSI